MKKMILVISIIMLIAMLFTFVACSADDYEKALRNDGYNVLYNVNSEDNELTLVATKKILGLNGDIEFIIGGVKEGMMKIYVKFEKTEDAKDCQKNFEEAGIEVKRSGNLVIYETEE